MNPRPRFSINRHRRARIALWAQAMLAWLTAAMFSEPKRRRYGVFRRRIRQRYRFASLGWAERLIRALAIARAIEIAGVAPRPARQLRNGAPPSARRRVMRAALLRAVVGGRFRRALKHRDLYERLRRLRAALADIDGLARRYLVARALNGLAKLYAIVIALPFAQALATLAAPAPAAADSS